MKNRFQIDAFTLLEVMVAVSIIAIVFVSVFKLHNQTVSLSISSRFYTTTTSLAQSKLAEFETGASMEPTDESGDFGDKFPGYNWRIAIEEIESEVFGDTVKGLKKIDLSVSLENTKDVYHIRTYRFLPE